nr:hypothetical protein [uncultured Rhodopila sp.]
MPIPSSHRHVTKEDVEKSVFNWQEWKAVFEHTGLPRTNPILTTKAIYDRFLYTYNVGRTVGERDALMQELRSDGFPLNEILADGTGEVLDLHIGKLGAAYGAFNTRYHRRCNITSAISKIMAFLKPASFIAFDSYARKGINVHTKRPKSHVFDCYADYRAAMESAMGGQVGNEVRAACGIYASALNASMGTALHLRVLDSYFMRIGGRWDPKLAKAA